MSADNGIYILKSPNFETGYTEYRVTYASAIENIYYRSNYGDFNSEALQEYFGNCNVLDSEIAAFAKAKEINGDLEKEGLYTEYGIQTIKMTNEFPT